MENPVEMVDYTSSLVAADWYEENGQQRIADEIRIRVTIPFFVVSARFRITSYRLRRVASNSGTKSKHKRYSSCGRKRGARSRSTCMYGIIGHYSQLSHSTSRSGL